MSDYITPVSVADATLAPPTPEKPTLPAEVTGAVSVLGEIVTWYFRGGDAGAVRIPLSAIRGALDANGLPVQEARDLLPRNAFSRVIHQLEEGRIVKKLGEDDDYIYFQFTREQLQAEVQRYQYDFEATITLNKDTGAIVCPAAPDLATLATAKLDVALGVRTANDVTRIVQRLFRKNADLFAVRDTGGVYFVPAPFLGFVDKVQKFVIGLNGVLQRFPVPKNTAVGDSSIRDVVLSGLKEKVDKLHADVAEFGTDTRPSTLERTAKRIQESRFKVDAYRELLKDGVELLTTALTDVSAELRAKVESINIDDSDDATTADAPADSQVADAPAA